MRVLANESAQEIENPTLSVRSDRQPLISIVLPTYNGSRYLREAIESCLAQSYRNWELIIVQVRGHRVCGLHEYWGDARPAAGGAVGAPGD